LVTPIFFQVVVDKVLTHKGYSTLYVLVAGLVLIGLFDVVLQYLRTYALSHTPTALTSNSGRDCSDIFCAFQSPISKREPQVRRSRVCVSSRTFAHF
jgi:ABC-type protease/lipase transport system fused ATPase/permease subunit